MKIIAPVDHLEEVEVLIKAGARQLYGGYVPDAWKGNYSLLGSINKRGFSRAQFSSEADLKEAVRLSHKNGAQFFLTLNINYFSGEQYDLLMQEVKKALEIGVDALIVADLGLILKIKKAGYSIKLHASTVGTTLSHQTALFYKDLGIERIILDRTLTVGEIKNLIEKAPGISFDAFIIYGRCPNIEGFCTLFHRPGPAALKPCGQQYTMSCFPKGKNGLCSQAIENQKGWSKTVRGKGCGLCALYDLSRTGIHGLKIVGRGRQTAHKLDAIEALVYLKGLLKQKNMKREDFFEQAKDVYKKLHGEPCDPFVCYHPYLTDKSLTLSGA